MNYFVRWVDCNTLFLKYILEYISRFFDHIYNFPHICFYFVIIYNIIWYQIWIFGYRVNPSPNLRPDPVYYLMDFSSSHWISFRYYFSIL